MRQRPLEARCAPVQCGRCRGAWAAPPQREGDTLKCNPVQ